MPTWDGGAPAEQGRGQSNGAFYETGDMQATGTSTMGGARWGDVPIQRGSTITSATLTLRSKTNVGDMSIALVDGLSSLSPSTPWMSAGGTLQLVPVADVTVDVTAGVQALVDRPGWAPGDSIVARLHYKSAPYSLATAVSLSVTYVPSVQYLAPVGPVTARAGALAVGTSSAVRAGVVTAHAQALPLDVVAPVLVSPAAPATSHAQAPAPTMSGTGAAPALDVAGVATAVAVTPGPSLSRTIPPEPPPIPWQRLVEDPAYHEALTARALHATSRTEIISPTGAVLARLGGTTATHPGALSGTVTCDGRAPIRWTCDLVLDNPDLMPARPGDLLHPLSHNRVRVWWGVRLPDGSLGEIPVGTYYPDLTPVSDDGATLGVVIRGSSAVAEIKRARWDTALDLSGLTISAAIGAVLTDRAPWATLAITPTDQRVPKAYEPGEPGGDPWEDVERLAAAAGMVAFEDRMGVIRVEPRPTPSTPRAVFTEGAGTSLLALPSVEVDLDDLVNRVTVTSASPDVDPPVSATVSDDDPSSPLWVGLGHLYSKRVENAIITTEAAARTMARNILADRAPVVTVQASINPHPHLDPGDTVAIGRARAGVAGDHTLQAWTLGLAPGDEMAITATTRKEL